MDPRRSWGGGVLCNLQAACSISDIRPHCADSFKAERKNSTYGLLGGLSDKRAPWTCTPADRVATYLFYKASLTLHSCEKKCNYLTSSSNETDNILAPELKTRRWQKTVPIQMSLFETR
jgi:hypothetical protein